MRSPIRGGNMVLTVKNREQLQIWMDKKKEHNLVAIKGPAPRGATYSDGVPITNPVNVAWHDCSTGEVFLIEYER